MFSTVSSLTVETRGPGKVSKLQPNEGDKESDWEDDGNLLPSLGNSPVGPSGVGQKSHQGTASDMLQGPTPPVAAMTPREMYNIMYHIGSDDGVVLRHGERDSEVGGTLVDILEASFPSVPPGAHCATLVDTYQAAYRGRSYRRSPPGASLISDRQADPLPHGSQVLEVSGWDFPSDDEGRGTMKKSDHVESQLVDGKDIDYFQLKTRSKTRRKRGRGECWSLRNHVHGESSNVNPYKQIPTNSLVRDISYDARYLQYDESPYGYLDQLIPRPGKIALSDPIPEIDTTFLRSIPDPPRALARSSRVGPGYQARVPKRKDNYHDKRNAAYLPE
jgi:hypothetical protein